MVCSVGTRRGIREDRGLQQPDNKTEGVGPFVPMTLRTPHARTVDRMVRTSRATFERVLAQWTGDLLILRARDGRAGATSLGTDALYGSRAA